jgi:hypothetical protein
LKHNDETYFYGAYRLDEHELQFKIVNLGWSAIGFVKGSTGGRDMCIMTEDQHEFMGGLKCADDPMENEGSIVIDHKEVGEHFLHFLVTETPVSGREGEWNLLRSMVERTLEHL